MSGRAMQIRGIQAASRVAAIAVAAVLFFAALSPLQAQTYTVLHNFTGGSDGAYPQTGLSMDRGGNLYGTASMGGHTDTTCSTGCGTVFKLTHKDSNWILSVLYSFKGLDGNQPIARVVIGPDGALYGTTIYGGAAGHGTVFRLRPPATLCKTVSCPWSETILHSFSGGGDGAFPEVGDLTFDSAGNIYGTTVNGGATGNGVVYQLTLAGGSWTENVLYSFKGNTDGIGPFGGVIFGQDGNLYGTTAAGGDEGAGTVFELARSGSGWTEQVLYSFTFGTDGGQPYGGLILDPAGNLYGASSVAGVFGGGTVYEMTPSGVGWNFNLLFSPTAYEGSVASLTMSDAGALYGTLLIGNVEVFQLTNAGGTWNQTGFSGSVSGYPFGNVILDESGSLYTTAEGGGGAGNYGAVFEITP